MLQRRQLKAPILQVQTTKGSHPPRKLPERRPPCTQTLSYVWWEGLTPKLCVHTYVWWEGLTPKLCVHTYVYIYIYIYICFFSFSVQAQEGLPPEQAWRQRKSRDGNWLQVGIQICLAT